VADTSHLPGYEPFPINYLFKPVQISQADYDALPAFSYEVPAGTRMKFQGFMATKESDTAFRLETPITEETDV
jgi:hypothetical protein